MKRLLAVLLTTAVLISTCSCQASIPADESSAAPSTEETTTTASETAETTTEAASTEPSYVTSGYLEGLRIDKNNFFANNDAKYQGLIEHIEKITSSNNFKGSLLLTTEDGIILYGGPNNSLTTAGDPVDPFTTYEIGSISKTFTAVVIMKLMEQGKISLDDKITKYFPDYKTGKDITVKNLLNMTSGIPDYVNNFPAFYGMKVTEQQKFLEMYNTDGLPDEDFLKYMYAAPLDFEPGKEFAYSNSNYHLLALIIEQIEGTSFGDAVSKYIFEPLGMEHSSSMTYGDVTSVTDEATGYHTFQLGARGAGDIHTCVADLLTFDKALLSGELVSEESLAVMQDYQFGEYGCGLYPYGDRMFGHSGAVSAYISQNIIIDSEEYGRVYFIASCPTILGEAGFSALLRVVFKEMDVTAR